MSSRREGGNVTRRLVVAACVLGTAGLLLGGCTATIQPDHESTTIPTGPPTRNDAVTTTPIKHVVVIYDENISFDHYFGTYPKAANSDGASFTAATGTPTPVNLMSDDLLTRNPNEFNPFRLTPSQAVTCDQNHSYGPEQQAADGGRNDKAVQFTSSDSCGIGGAFSKIGLTMGYFDGNTVTALWNYAQNYSLNDHSFSSTFGPSTPGALNLIAGQTHGMKAVDPHTGAVQSSSIFVSSPDASHVGTDTDDADPAFDDCSGNGHTSSISLGEMSGTNVGDLLNAKSVSWGWFQGGFAPTTSYSASTGALAKCNSAHADVAGSKSRDYVPHHDPFQFYRSTANPHHLPPTSTAEIGQTDQANHNYDLSDFSAALQSGVLPAVSFLKPAAYQNGHAGNSDPIDEQHFLVSEINAIEKSKYWSSTAIVVAYDDSDGWYDQLGSPILNGSDDPLIAHELVGDQPECVSAAKSQAVGILDGYKDRCGPGTRQPLLVISPYARSNFIDSTPTEQASILAFIENNWRTGRIGGGSFDARAGSLDAMFDFTATSGIRLLLGRNGAVASSTRISVVPAP
jgi:phospholipase C